MRYRTGIGALLCAVVAVTTSPARCDETTRSPGLHSVRIYLDSKNGSDEAGTATLSSSSGKTRVIIVVRGEPADALQPANIQAGQCGRVEIIKYELRDVRNGRSMSLVDVPFSRLSAAHVVINIQESKASLHAPKDARDVSCGAIP